MGRIIRSLRCCRPSACLAAVIVAFIFANGSERVAQTGGRPGQLADVVKATLQTEPTDAAGFQTVNVTLAISSGWHLYANPAGSDSVRDSQTTLTCKSGNKQVDARISYPHGKDAVAVDGSKVRIYEEQVVISVRLRRGERRIPVTITIKAQACNDQQRRCLTPGTLVLELR